MKGLQTMTTDEKKWQAESDAETLARYQEIISDKNRKAAAVKVAKTRAAELAKRVQAMQLAAGGKISGKKK